MAKPKKLFFLFIFLSFLLFPRPLVDASVSSCTASVGTSSMNTNSNSNIGITVNNTSSSSIDYGKDDSYGSNKNDSSATTSHSLTPDGLSANTTYHFNVKSTDSAGNTGESGDETFVTAAAGTTGTTKTVTVTTTKTTTTTATITATPTPTPIPDRTGPDIAIVSDFSKPLTVSPKINGTASDPSGVKKIDYSIDNG